MLSAFLKSRRQGISKNTLLFYQRCLSKAIDIELTPEGITSFLSSLSCSNGKHAYYRALRALCYWLHKHKYLPDNPITMVATPITAKKLLPSITTEQVRILLDTTDNLRDKCIICLLFDSGFQIPHY